MGICAAANGHCSSAASDSLILRGGRGDDLLFGGRGDDFLDGGSGADVMLGGKGSDTFVARIGDGSADMSEVDAVYDFEDGSDVIGLECLSYQEITIEQGNTENSGDVFIHYQDEYLLSLKGITSSSISAPDFSSISECDQDDDGVKDHIDAFPDDPSEVLDTDEDATWCESFSTKNSCFS